eukprot:m.630255 g.630255  ORF g.630255 m.630255 type:complete len:52 (+) comp22565_c2_seq17:1889-2044(+)
MNALLVFLTAPREFIFVATVNLCVGTLLKLLGIDLNDAIMNTVGSGGSQRS